MSYNPIKKVSDVAENVPGMNPWTDQAGAVADIAEGKNPLDAVADKLGVGAGKGPADTAHAQGYLGQATHAYDNIGTPAAINPQAQTSSAGLDPAAQKAQAAQLAALSALAANGGRSAASDANLAHIREQEGMTAQGMRGAVMQDAARRGMGNGNSALLAQLSSNQAAVNTASMEGAQVAGQEANTAIQAGQGAAGIGASQQQQALEAAAAHDAMARFNAGQDLNAQQYNSQAPIATQLATASGQQAGGKVGADYWSAKLAADERAKSGVTGGILGAVGSIGAAAMSRGGEVPGPEIVPGDSRLNDVVPYKGPSGSPIHLSGGEVVVPKSLRQADDGSILDFVHNPPKTAKPLHDMHRSAKLAALHRLGSK